MEHAASPTRRDQALAFDVWKYHASVGGADKDRMVQITTWLLGFSAGILSLHATGKLTAPWAPILLIVLGILVSALAAFVALLYGGYATWRWAIADQIATAEAKIAEAYPWSVLLPTNALSFATTRSGSRRDRLYLPTDPATRWGGPWTRFRTGLGTLRPAPPRGRRRPRERRRRAPREADRTVGRFAPAAAR
jgi:hypothetical protein